jgi:hypothetical protein
VKRDQRKEKGHLDKNTLPFKQLIQKIEDTLRDIVGGKKKVTLRQIIQAGIQYGIVHVYHAGYLYRPEQFAHIIFHCEDGYRCFCLMKGKGELYFELKDELAINPLSERYIEDLSFASIKREDDWINRYGRMKRTKKMREMDERTIDYLKIRRVKEGWDKKPNKTIPSIPNNIN